MTASPQHRDVLIVGAGIAGLALAAALSAKGVQVSVLEAGPRPIVPDEGVSLNDWDLRVSALTPTSIRLLEQLGVWSLLQAVRVGPYEHMHVWDADGTGDITFKATDIGVPALGYIVENRLTIEALLRVVEPLRGVEIIWNDPVSSLTRDLNDYPLITTEAGSQFCAPLLVGADGARSRLRELAEFEVRRWSYHQSAIVGTVALASSHRQTCYQAFTPDGPLALLPLAKDNDCALVWSLDDGVWERLLALSDGDFVAALNRALGGQAPEITAIGERAAFPLNQCHAVDYIQPRIALVADAAHSIHPLAGQGINLGLADVQVLAEEIDRALKEGLDWGEISVLRRYQRRRKTENLAMMAAMEGFKRGFGSQHPLLRVARNFGLSWVDRAGPIKHWLAQQALG